MPRAIAINLSLAFTADQHYRLVPRKTITSTPRNSLPVLMSLGLYFVRQTILLISFRHAAHAVKIAPKTPIIRAQDYNVSRYQGWVIAMNKLAKDLADKGVTVINCSRQTALKCFPRSTIQKELPDEVIPLDHVRVSDACELRA